MRRQGYIDSTNSKHATFTGAIPGAALNGALAKRQCANLIAPDYFCFEVDSRGRVFDYRASYYCHLDTTWKQK
jgi:hypothetical protein